MRYTALTLVLLALAVGCGKKKEDDTPMSEGEREAVRDYLAKGKGPKDRPGPVVKGAAPEAKAEPKADVKYAGMNEWVQVGDVRVKLKKAVVDKAIVLNE